MGLRLSNPKSEIPNKECPVHYWVVQEMVIFGRNF